jgi:hypothetical protein
MKITEKTFDVFKNFASINPSIAVKVGNTLRTVSEQKNILAQANIDETFSKDFAIYDLNQFLGLSSLFNDADYSFGESSLTISEGTNKSRYTYADPSMVTQPPKQNLDLPSQEVKFSLRNEDLKKVIDGANQLGLPEIVVRGNGLIHLVATDTKNPTCNEFSHELNSTTDAEFEFVFKVENFKFMAQDYDVTMSKQGISHFKGTSVQYWVANEAGSNYNEGSND